MKTAQKIFQSAKNLFTFPKKSSSPAIQCWVSGDDLDRPQLKFHEPYSQSPWINIAISVLAENLAHIPFRISRTKRGADDVIESGPVVELFENPHPSLTRTLFWQTLVSWEALRGEFFVLPLDKTDRPVSLRSLTHRLTDSPTHDSGIKSLLPLNPDHFQHLIQANRLAGWRYTCHAPQQPMQSQILLPEEVIHSRNFNPYTFWRGLSPLTVALLPATTDYAAAQFMKGVMLNNGDAGLIITTPEMLTNEQRAQLQAEIDNRKRGVGTADKSAFLWGNAKIDKPMISSVDLQFMENRKLNRQEIGAIYKVPEALMGFSTEKSGLSAGTGIEQDRLNFIENTMTAICRRLEAAIDPIVKTFGADLYGWFDLESLPIMQNARRQRIAAAASAWQMGVPLNAINQVYQLGFPNFSWGNDAYLPTNIQKVGQWAQPRKFVAADVRRLTHQSADAAVTKMLELLERTTK
jgi:HK97 family phage portal protein